MGKKVLLVGWHPSVVNYEKWPGLTAEKLEAALTADKNRLVELGYDASLGFLHSGDTATEAVEELLGSASYDVVLIGAGVRKDDDHFFVFEKLINVVHEKAPTARIAFNTGPTDSDEAVQRWG